MRLAALAIILLASTAHASPLHVRDGRLVGEDSSGQGQTDSALAWESSGSSWSLRNDGAELHVTARLDVRGTPWWLNLDLRQYDDGSIRLDMVLTGWANAGGCWSLDFASYDQAQHAPLPYGGFLPDALARFAGGQPPVDVDRLSARLSAAERRPTYLTGVLIDGLNSADWRTREGASILLAEMPDLYPELRHTLHHGDPTPEQQARISAILTTQDVPEAVMAMVR